MKVTRLIFFLTLAALVSYFATLVSCTKEYSCENCFVQDITIRDSLPPRDTTIISDTTKIDSTINFPFCLTCSSNSTYIINKWVFRNYQSLICGNIYDARIDSIYLDSGYDVTIRGFQNCVRDTQFIINGVFPPRTFDSDRTNIAASYSNFLLYAPNNVILAVTGGTPGTPLTMNMILDTFNHTTGIANFRFFGYAYTNKGGSSYIIGNKSYISDGRVKAKIR